MEKYDVNFTQEEKEQLVLSSAELSFEVSESSLCMAEIIRSVESAYPGWRFNRSEARYDSCVMAIFEYVGK